MTQGERVKLIRKDLGMTLEQFGECLGVQRSAISKIERGERNLTDQMVKSICREYRVNYDYLIYGDGEMFGALPDTILNELCEQYNLDSDDKELLQRYIDLSPDERKAVKKMLISKK